MQKTSKEIFTNCSFLGKGICLLHLCSNILTMRIHDLCNRKIIVSSYRRADARMAVTVLLGGEWRLSSSEEVGTH